MARVNKIEGRRYSLTPCGGGLGRGVAPSHLREARSPLFAGLARPPIPAFPHKGGRRTPWTRVSMRPHCSSARGRNFEWTLCSMVEDLTKPRQPIPAGYRQGVISAITVLIGFSLVFMRYWSFEAQGEPTRPAIVAGLGLLLAILLEFYALWRALQVEDDHAPHYPDDPALVPGVDLRTAGRPCLGGARGGESGQILVPLGGGNS